MTQDQATEQARRAYNAVCWAEARWGSGSAEVTAMRARYARAANTAHGHAMQARYEARMAAQS